MKVKISSIMVKCVCGVTFVEHEDKKECNICIQRKSKKVDE